MIPASLSNIWKVFDSLHTVLWMGNCEHSLLCYHRTLRPQSLIPFFNGWGHRRQSQNDFHIHIKYWKVSISSICCGWGWAYWSILAVQLKLVSHNWLKTLPVPVLMFIYVTNKIWRFNVIFMYCCINYTIFLFIYTLSSCLLLQTEMILGMALVLSLQLHLSCINMYCQNTSFVQDNNARGDLG